MNYFPLHGKCAIICRDTFKLLISPGIVSATLCSLVGRYDKPIPTQFLAPIDCSKILAPYSVPSSNSTIHPPPINK
jgi:hypothetical protein